MMKKAINKTRRNRKERKAGFWAVSLILSFQVLGWVFFSMATPGLIEAKTFTVTSTLDETDKSPGDGVCVSTSGYCTLRAAIQEANAFTGPDTIKLKKGIYMLTIPDRLENNCAKGDLDIYDDLTITGTGAKNTIINGDQLDRVFHILEGASVTIAKVTILNGLATDIGYESGGQAIGGAILNDGTSLKVTGCTLSNNVASATSAWGGAIFNIGGDVTVEKSTLSSNLARGTSDGGGGAFCNTNGGTSGVTGCTLSMNAASGGVNGTGGAIENGYGSWLVITKTTLSNNVASGLSYAYGGAIHNSPDSTLILTGSTISNNVVSGLGWGYGGAICNYGGGTYGGTVTVTKSTISDNSISAGTDTRGGGIYTDEGLLTVTQSTLSNNTALGTNGVVWGGGIFNSRGPLTVTRSTISNNTALGTNGYSYGGGICAISAKSPIMVTGSKINNNTASGSEGGFGGAIYFISSDVTVNSSTISGNAASGLNGVGYGGGIHQAMGPLTVQNRSKIIKNLASYAGGGISNVNLASENISPDSTISWNMPDNIFPAIGASFAPDSTVSGDMPEDDISPD